MYFIELLMIHSLISNDSEISEKEYIESKNNLSNIAHNGRDKKFKLKINKKCKSIEIAVNEILCDLKKIAEFMFKITKDSGYKECINTQEEKFKNNENLPSNKVINKMNQNKFSFYEFCMENIWLQEKYYLKLDFDDDIINELKEESILSINQQETLENNIKESYEDYIKEYFSEK